VASENGHVGVVKVLLAAQANVDAVNKVSETNIPIMHSRVMCFLRVALLKLSRLNSNFLCSYMWYAG
jgi:hypothetical protein